VAQRGALGLGRTRQQRRSLQRRRQQGRGLALDHAPVHGEIVRLESGGLELEDLALTDEGRGLRHQQRELGAAAAGQQSEHARQHEVARHDGDHVAVAPEGRRRPAARLGVVDQVVVEQRGGVQHLDGERHPHGRFRIGRHQIGCEERERRPQALPTGADEVVADGLDEGDVGAELRT
jgi:hypothetical protein